MFYPAKIIQFTDIKNDLEGFKALKIAGFGMSDFLCIFAAEYVLTTFDNVSKCGEIWLLATTLKNAKILTWVTVQRCPPDISMFLCFCDRSAFLWGFFVARGSSPSYPEKPHKIRTRCS